MLAFEEVPDDAESPVWRVIKQMIFRSPQFDLVPGLAPADRVALEAIDAASRSGRRDDAVRHCRRSLRRTADPVSLQLVLCSRLMNAWTGFDEVEAILTARESPSLKPSAC